VGCIDFSKKKPSINCNNNYLFLFGYDINSPGWRRRGPLFHSPAGGRIRHVSIKTNHHHLSISPRFLLSEIDYDLATYKRARERRKKMKVENERLLFRCAA
jgi:hypothetical protein